MSEEEEHTDIEEETPQPEEEQEHEAETEPHTPEDPEQETSPPSKEEPRPEGAPPGEDAQEEDKPGIRERLKRAISGEPKPGVEVSPGEEEEALLTVKERHKLEDCRRWLTALLHSDLGPEYKDRISIIRDHLSRARKTPPLGHIWAKLEMVARGLVLLTTGEGYDLTIGRDLIHTGIAGCLKENYVPPGPKPPASFYLPPSDPNKTDQQGRRVHPTIPAREKAKRKRTHPQKGAGPKPQRKPDPAYHKRVAVRKAARREKDQRLAEKLEEARRREQSGH